MMTIRSRDLPGGYKCRLVEDSKRNRYIELFDPDGHFIVNIGPTNRYYGLFEAMLAQSPVVDDKELLALYEKSHDSISHKYGRILDYGRAVIQLTWQRMGTR